MENEKVREDIFGNMLKKIRIREVNIKMLFKYIKCNMQKNKELSLSFCDIIKTGDGNERIARKN